jgi:hypothetical protein
MSAMRIPIQETLVQPDEVSRSFVCKTIGFFMEPSIPHDSLNVFRTGVDGSYQHRVLLVERSDMIGKAGSFSVGFYSVAPASHSSWADQIAHLSFLSSQCPPIELTPGRHRIVAEWVQVYEPAGPKQTAEGLYSARQPKLSQGAAVTEWLSMPVDQVALLAGAHPAPPEVFAQHRNLIKSNAALAHLSMVNFQAFCRWALQHNDGNLLEMASAWILRGSLFSDWYTQVILPLFTTVQ